MNMINLCQHTISLLQKGDGLPPISVPASGQVARCKVLKGEDLPALSTELGVEVKTASTMGAVEGLPPPETGMIFLVSTLVATHPDVRGRRDVFSPGELVRGADGQPTGCRGLGQAPKKDL